MNQHRTSTEPAPNQPDVVGTWTGAMAAALRTASRYSQEAFAARLGISARTVAKWHQHPDAVLRPFTSGMLDTVLRLAPVDVRERFAMLTQRRVSSQPHDNAETRRP